MIFYANFNENLTQFNAFTGGALGVIIRIQNNSYLTYQKFDALNVPCGFETNVAVERVFKLTLPKPYSNCDLPNDIASDSYSYSLFSNSNLYSDLYDVIHRSPYQYNRQVTNK